MKTSTDPDVFWVRYDARLALVALEGLSPAADLAHRRFCDLVWAGRPWPPADPRAAARLAHATPRHWPDVLRKLARLGWQTSEGALVNPAVAAVLEEARAYLRQRREICVAAAQARWHSDGHASCNVSAMPDPCTVTVQKQRTATAIKPDERLTLSGSTREQPRDGEREFLEELRQALQAYNPQKAEGELTNWGGWWRNRFRENPAKARHVLAELRSMIRGGRIRRNPGAAAKDLWDRLP